MPTSTDHLIPTELGRKTTRGKEWFQREETHIAKILTSLKVLPPWQHSSMNVRSNIPITWVLFLSLREIIRLVHKYTHYTRYGHLTRSGKLGHPRGEPQWETSMTTSSMKFCISVSPGQHSTKTKTPSLTVPSQSTNVLFALRSALHHIF